MTDDGEPADAPIGYRDRYTYAGRCNRTQNSDEQELPAVTDVPAYYSSFYPSAVRLGAAQRGVSGSVAGIATGTIRHSLWKTRTSCPQLASG